MKKGIKWVSLVMTVIMMAMIMILPIGAASGSARVFYRTTQGNPTGINISNWLAAMGYTSTSTVNATPATVLSALQNSKVVHIICHGNTGFLALENGNLTVDTLSTRSFNNIKFVYTQACYSATTNTAGQSVISTIYNNGATSAMGFNGTVTGGVDTGVHQFSIYFYQQIYNNNYTLQQAAVAARNLIYAETGQDYNVGCRSILGYNTKIK